LLNLCTSLLLEKEVDVNAQGGQYGTALQALFHQGHKEIVKLLIETEADVNAQGGEFANAH
jgi:ankyrin repeat protein